MVVIDAVFYCGSDGCVSATGDGAIGMDGRGGYWQVRIVKEIAFCGDRGEFSSPTALLLPDNWYKWKTSKGSGDNAAFDAHFKAPDNRDKFWAPANTGATAHVDLDGPRAILLPGIFGAYVMEAPRTIHDLFTFTVEQTTGVGGQQPLYAPGDVVQILNWCLMASQADGQGNSQLNVKLAATFSVCDKFNRWK